MIHVHRAREQPATRYVVRMSDNFRLTILNKPRALMRCHKCKKLRWAKNCVVQAYYDGVYQWCRKGKGCRV